MIECCHRKAVRFKIDEELACKLLKVDDGWDIEDLLKAPFTTNFMMRCEVKL